MPDEYGFNWLADKRVCIVEGCGEGGWAWEWPDERRRAHSEEHRQTRRRAINEAATARLRKEGT